MNEALEYLYKIYFSFLNFIFEDLEFFRGVTVGYVILTLTILAMIIPIVSRSAKKIDFSSKRGGKNNE